MRKHINCLEKALTPGSLVFNKKKSEIISTSNCNQPTNLTDWQTDAEDNKPEGDIPFGADPKAKKVKGSNTKPICLDGTGRKNGRKHVARTELTEFYGIKIVARVKYLGLSIEPTIATTVTAVKNQVSKYVDYFKAKTNTGVNGLDKSIVAAYIKSLLCCFLPPLVAIDALTKSDGCQLNFFIR